jgi:hypothetical protein
MPAYFFDTSALVKRYHIEEGSEKVDEIFNDPGGLIPHFFRNYLHSPAYKIDTPFA